MDVPADGVTLQFGFFLKGTGTVWCADFAVTPVGEDTPVTGTARQSQRSPNWLLPANLDFSEVADLVR